MQQVTVRSVNFQNLEARLQRSARGSLEGGDDAVDTGRVQRFRCRRAFIEGLSARPYYRPAALLVAQCGATLPGQIGAGLATRMRKLDSRNRALTLQEADNARQRLDVLIRPNAEITRRDATLGRDRRGFDQNQRSASDRTAAEVHQVPVIGIAVGR